MRRFLTLVCLLSLAIPAGISISGCTRNPGANYCNGLGYGLKITDVDAIALSPQTGGLSMAFGQTRQISAPSATTCKGTSAAVPSFNYATTNNQLVDISPGGAICAGTWNRNTGGGIGNYTICTPPSPLPSTNGLPFSSAYISVSASGVTSNPVQVFVHAPVTALSLVGPSQCLSQGQMWQTPLDVQAYYATGNPANPQGLLCAPNSSTVPECLNAIGALNFFVGTSSVATINNTTNQITANLPGTTLITASVAGTSSSAGYFTTCPPASISVTLESGGTSGQINQGATPQNLVTNVIDTQGNPLTGLSLDYQSTDQIDITAGTGGSVNAAFPGVASIYAVCQPPSCNSAPINILGQSGTGLAITSNPVQITTPGTASQYLWFAAPGQSQYFVPIELLTGTVGTSVRMPYVPNSAVMDKGGNNLYFGSSHELMVYTALTNSLSKQDTSVPGVVLAVAPDNSQILINDPVRQFLYLYSTSGGVIASFGGMGAAAAWTPDAKTLYVTDSAALGGNHTDAVYVYNANTGWSTFTQPCTGSVTCSHSANGGQSLAITVPSVGAYFSGASTVSHTWCPTGTVGGILANGTTVNSILSAYYPQADAVTAPTSLLAATTDGNHILGASLAGSTISISDISVSIPATACPWTESAANKAANSQPETEPHAGDTLNLLTTKGKLAATLPVSQVTVDSATNLNQIVVSPSSSLAFLTYSGDTAGAPLPYYLPDATTLPSGGHCTLASGGTGALCYLTLTDSTPATITGPVAGAFSPDNKLFFVSTAGDNKIHYLDLTGATPVDKQQITPNLPACASSDQGCANPPSGPSVIPATVIAVRPRSTT
jgi:sugar lactone lactonase YvrE